MHLVCILCKFCTFRPSKSTEIFQDGHVDGENKASDNKIGTRATAGHIGVHCEKIFV